MNQKNSKRREAKKNYNPVSASIKIIEAAYYAGSPEIVLHFNSSEMGLDLSKGIKSKYILEDIDILVDRAHSADHNYLQVRLIFDD